MSAYPFNFRLQLNSRAFPRSLPRCESGHAGSSHLEQHVLQKMGYTVVLWGLKSAPRINKYADGGSVTVGSGSLAGNSQSVG